MQQDEEYLHENKSAKLLSIGEASEYLGVSIDTLRRWERRKKITALRSPGGHRYFNKDDLDALFGRKYERAPETQPRKISESVEIIEDKAPEVPKPEPEVKEEMTLPIPPEVFPEPGIFTREPREIKVPLNEPIRIIQTASVLEVREVITEQSSYIPLDTPPAAVSESRTIPQINESILTPPSDNPEPPPMPFQPAQNPAPIPQNYKTIIIISSIFLFIVFMIITYLLWRSSQQVLSPIP